MGKSKRCIFLAGAPRDESLSWDEDDLQANFDFPVQRFLGTQDVSNYQAVTPTPLGSYAKWRSVDCNGSDTRLSNKHPGVLGGRNQISNNTLNVSEHLEDAEFVEHSLAVLENIDTSQIIPTAAAEQGANADETTDFPTADLSLTSTTCTDITNASFVTASPTQVPPPPFKIPGGISDLKSLPKADHITRIHPQTITLNLLVGVIAISPARTIRIRRGNAEKEIIELTVGDDTRAGFSISFWLTPLPNPAHQQAQDRGGAKLPDNDLRTRLHRLRPGDVILLQNIALSSWRENVYGQSLSRRFARNETSITPLTAAWDTMQSGLSLQVAGKLKRVRVWARDFVGTGTRGGRDLDDGRDDVGEKDVRGKKRRIEELQLPPDTQD